MTFKSTNRKDRASGDYGCAHNYEQRLPAYDNIVSSITKIVHAVFSLFDAHMYLCEFMQSQ